MTSRKELFKRLNTAEQVRQPSRKGALNAHRQSGAERPSDGDPEPGPRVETFTAADLLQEQLPEPKWAVEGFLPEGECLLCGRPKQGKSWAALNIGLAVATGGCALGVLRANVGDVLYLALEDTKRRLQARILKLLQGAVPPERLVLAREWPRQDKGGLEAIEEWLSRHPEARLVVVDTLQKFRPPKLRGGSDYEQDYTALSALKSLADKYRVCVLIIHHTRKAGATDAVEEISGTFGVSGCADGLFVLRRDRGRQDATLLVTGRDLDEKEYALSWDPQYCQWSIQGDAEEFRLNAERAKVIELFRRENRALSPSEVAPLLGKTPGATKSLLWRMGTDGLLRSTGKGKYLLIESNFSNSSKRRNRSNPSNPGEAVAAGFAEEEDESNRGEESQDPFD